MTVHCLAAVLTLMVAAEPKPPTFGEILGMKQVSGIVKMRTELFVRRFHEMTAKEIGVEKNFYDAVVMPIAATGAPTKVTEAEVVLGRGFEKFLSDLTAFLLAVGTKPIFEAKAVGQYLEAARKAGVCGEIPSARGCGGNPCDWWCGSCTTTPPAGPR